MVALLASACSSNKVDAERTADKNARYLLAKYKLHPAGAPKVIKFNKKWRNDRLFEHFFKLKVDASKDIGLDPSKYRTQDLDIITFSLEERSQFKKKNPSAHFMFDSDGTIRGAYLFLEGYAPGIVSLKDRSYFLPATP